jgi:hypothetical protein
LSNNNLGGYYFFSNDEPSENPIVNRAIPYEDIESVWTYIYYSYSAKEKKAVAMLTFKDGDVQ